MDPDLKKLQKPALENLNPHFILGEIRDHILGLAPKHPNVDLNILRDWVEDVRNHQVNLEKTLRRLLVAFWKTDSLQERLNALDEESQAKIVAFKNGKSADDIFAAKKVRQNHSFSGWASNLGERLSSLFQRAETNRSDKEASISVESLHKQRLADYNARGLPVVYEDDAKKLVMEVYENLPFSNWGQVVEANATPSFTFVPTKVKGVQNLINHDVSKGKRIRCAGYRHSWTPVFSDDKQILLSMLPIKQVTSFPDASVILPTSASNATNDFKSISVVSENGDHALIRVGTATTAEEFRRWQTSNGKWALPMDVILCEVTMGGTVGTICHGAGKEKKTINDQITAIEYVDAHGKLQKISDLTDLKAAAGCLGLIGVITHITYKLIPMTYAVIKPKKVDVGLAIPPLNQSDIPVALQKTFSATQIDNALDDFVARAETDFYAEWIWCGYQSTVWVNTWDTDSSSNGSREYTSPVETFLQFLENWLGGVLTSTALYKALPGRWQAQLLASATMASFPPTTFDKKDIVIKTQLPNALHFRRDAQNLRVRDMELQIPITKNAEGKLDWNPIRKAWWDVINLVYSEVDSPLRLLMDLRIMADSELIMAAQTGNTWGTASIEVLTIPDAVEDGEWYDFCQKVCDMWMGWTKVDGNLVRDALTDLNVRPHWGKEWTHLTMRGKPAIEYLKHEAYGDAIKDFKAALGKIGGAQGWTVDDLQNKFSNTLWDKLIFEI